jgi:hypothetical protein
MGSAWDEGKRPATRPLPLIQTIEGLLMSGAITSMRFGTSFVWRRTSVKV